MKCQYCQAECDNLGDHYGRECPAVAKAFGKSPPQDHGERKIDTIKLYTGPRHPEQHVGRPQYRHAKRKAKR